MFRHQRGRKYLPLPMSGESKEAISWYFMISHLVISCRLLWLPMTSQDFDRYPQIWVPSLQTITCWHQENESWLVKIPDHTAFSAAGAGGTSWLEATTKCNIKCWGIKEAGITGHCQCGEMSKQAISWYFVLSYLVDSYEFPRFPKIFPDLYNKTNSHEFPHCRPSQADTKEM